MKGSWVLTGERRVLPGALQTVGFLQTWRKLCQRPLLSLARVCMHLLLTPTQLTCGGPALAGSRGEGWRGLQEHKLSFRGDPGALSQPGCQGERGYPVGTAESTEPSSNLVSSQGAGARLGVVQRSLLCSLLLCPAVTCQGPELFPWKRS